MSGCRRQEFSGAGEPGKESGDNWWVDVEWQETAGLYRNAEPGEVGIWLKGRGRNAKIERSMSGTVT